jgi:hypothetical protein
MTGQRAQQETGIDLRVLSRCTHVAGSSADAETDGSERLGTSLVTRRAHRHEKSITDRDGRPDQAADDQTTCPTGAPGTDPAFR